MRRESCCNLDLPHGVLVALDPMPSDRFGRTPLYRLRLALKRLLRDYGLRAEFYRELGPGELRSLARNHGRAA